MIRDYYKVTEKIQRNLMAAAQKNGFDCDLLAMSLGKEPSTYKNYTYFKNMMPLESFVGVVIEVGAVETVAFLARAVNCVVIPLPKALSEDSDYFKKASVILRETGEVMQSIGDALSDGVYTRAEKKDTVQQIDDAVAALVELKETLKAGLKNEQD